MHFEVLVEDRSGKEALDTLLPKILEDEHTWRIHFYRGIGRLPSDLKRQADPKKRVLLAQLPRLIQGYGNAFKQQPDEYRSAVICICDLDRRCRREFRLELLNTLNQCTPKPETYFFIAEEEGEAWLLGDAGAVMTAYPAAQQPVLEQYVVDSICGTWETLADAVHPGGSKLLKQKRYSEIGEAKCTWARNISNTMDVESNSSPSFQYFRDKLRLVSTRL